MFLTENSAMVSTIVLIVASSFFVTGSVVEFIRVRREYRESPSRKPDFPKAVGGLLAWIGLTTTALLIAAYIRDSYLDTREIAHLVFVLGFAADRISYLVATWPSVEGKDRKIAAGMAAASFAVLGGVAVGLSS